MPQQAVFLLNYLTFRDFTLLVLANANSTGDVMAKVICSTCRFRYKDVKLPQGMIQCSLTNARKKAVSPRECQEHRVLAI
jgi:hypothetical protein